MGSKPARCFATDFQEVADRRLRLEGIISAGRSRSKVHPMVPVWVSFVVNLVPIQSEGFLGIQKLSKRVA